MAVDETPGVNGVWIEPAPEELIIEDVKQCADLGGVKPVKIPGYWYFSKSLSDQVPPLNKRSDPGDKVMLYFHGGAFVAFSAHPHDFVASIPRGLVDSTYPVIQSIFSVEYRLTSGAPLTEANPFPAALIDALAGYRHLRKLGYQPENIIVGGDSAGANLSLALIRYLLEIEASKLANAADEPRLGVPGALLLLSPWADPAAGLRAYPQTSSNVLNAKSDIFDGPRSPMIMYGAHSYIGRLDKSELSKNVYIVPASPEITDISFKGFPKTFIVAGGAEYAVDTIRVLRDRMVADLGKGDSGVMYHESVDAVHDHLVAEWFEPQRTQTLSDISAWLDRIFA